MKKLLLLNLFIGCFFYVKVNAQQLPMYAKQGITPVAAIEMLNFAYHDPQFSDTGRTQHIYLPNDLNATSGYITDIYLKKSNASSIIFENFTLSLGQVNITNYPSPGGANYINPPFLTTCFQQTSFSFSGMGWVKFALSTPFQYDATQSLILDILVEGASHTSGTLIDCTTLFIPPTTNIKSIFSGFGAGGGYPNVSNLIFGGGAATQWPDFGIDVVKSLYKDPYVFPPLANFAYDEGIDTVWVNSPYTFVNTSSLDSLSYWDITPLNETRNCVPSLGCFLSTERNYNRVFTQTGYYNVKLVVSNKLGIDSIVKKIYVGNQTRKPRAEFYFDKLTMGIGQQVKGYDYSHYGPTGWEWTTNPKTISITDTNVFLPANNVSNPLFGARELGTFDVCLKVWNNIGYDSICKPNYLAVSSGNRMCTGDNSSHDQNGYLYSNNGPVDSYDPVTMGTNCSYYINPCATSLTAYIEKFKLRNKDSISFRDGGPDGTLIRKIGGSNITPTQRNLYAFTGRLYVEWHLNNNLPINGGDSGLVLQWTSIPAPYSSPKALFSCSDTIYSGQNLIFTNQTIGEGVLEYSWDVNGDSTFDDFTTPDGANHTFVSEDRMVKYVCLKVRNCKGESQYCKQLTVLPITQKPEVRFTVNMTSGFTSDIFKFTDQTLYGAATWAWNIGPGNVQYVNGTTASSQNPQVMLSNIGSYTVSLTVTNPFDNTTLTKTNYIQILSYSAPNSEYPIASGSDIGISNVKISYLSPAPSSQIIVIDTTTALKTPIYDKIFESRSLLVYKGVNYTIDVSRRNSPLSEDTVGISAMDRKIWLDKNFNASFLDPGEELLNEQNTFNISASTNFMIPSEIEIGRSMRLRVGISQGNTTLTPDKATSGCYEDYGLEVGLDPIPPQINLKGDSIYRVEVNKEFIDPGVSAIDNLEGEIGYRAETVSNLDTSKAGIYTIKYFVKDLYGNVSDTVERTVQMEINRTGPVITLIGADTQYIEVYNSYIDSGATAKDNIGIDISTRLIKSGNVDTSQLGIYYITYTVTDQFDYLTIKTRVVYVRDTQAPVITTLYGGSTIRHQIGTTYTDLNIVVTDNYYSRQQITLARTGTVNSNTSGTYYLRYTACDPSLNCLSDYYVEVNVSDTIPPTVKLLGDNPLYIEVYESFIDPGVTAFDNYYSPNSLIILKNSTINVNKLDTYNIQYTIRDGAGNIAMLDRDVITIDNKAPEIHLLGSNPFEMNRYKDYEEPGYKVVDNYYSDDELNKLVKITSDLGVRNNDTLWADLSGWKYVRYQVTDLSGNISEVIERQIRVFPERVGLKNSPLSNDISIYPNPNNGAFELKVSNSINGKFDLNIYNALGKIVHMENINKNLSSNDIIQINTQNLATGIYLIELRNNTTIYTKKFIIK